MHTIAAMLNVGCLHLRGLSSAYAWLSPAEGLSAVVGEDVTRLDTFEAMAHLHHCLVLLRTLLPVLQGNTVLAQGKTNPTLGRPVVQGILYACLVLLRDRNPRVRLQRLHRLHTSLSTGKLSRQFLPPRSFNHSTSTPPKQTIKLSFNMATSAFFQKDTLSFTAKVFHFTVRYVKRVLLHTPKKKKNTSKLPKTSPAPPLLSLRTPPLSALAPPAAPTARGR